MGVYLTFLLGLINMGVSLVRFVKLYIEGEDGRTPLVVAREFSFASDIRSLLTHADFWNSLDMYIGLVIACLPSLRPYFNLAAESRAFNYVKGKAAGRGSSRYTTGATRSTESARLSKHGEAFAGSANNASQPSLYDVDTESHDESLGAKGETKNQIIEMELARVRTRADEAGYQ